MCHYDARQSQNDPRVPNMVPNIPRIVSVPGPSLKKVPDSPKVTLERAKCSARQSESDAKVVHNTFPKWSKAMSKGCQTVPKSSQKVPNMVPDNPKMVQDNPQNGTKYIPKIVSDSAKRVPVHSRYGANVLLNLSSSKSSDFLKKRELLESYDGPGGEGGVGS